MVGGGLCGVCESAGGAGVGADSQLRAAGISARLWGINFFLTVSIYRIMENEAPEQPPKKKHELTEARRAALAKARVKAYEVRLQNKALRDKEKAANLAIAEKAIRDNEARIEALARQAEGSDKTEEEVAEAQEVEQVERLEEEDESEPDEVIEERIVKKKPKKKKPVRWRVIVVEESDSEDDVEEEAEATEVKIPKAKAADRSASMAKSMFSM